jgi:hypothetical protein
MLRISRGENVAAADLLRGLPDLDPDDAFHKVAMYLTIPTRGTPLEVPALQAFGISPDDPTVIRALLEALLPLGYSDVSRRLAERLLTMRPGDSEATAAIAHIDSLSVPLDQVTQEAGSLTFPAK